MKKLILIRHANAPKSLHSSDAEREIDELGIRQAALSAKHLEQYQLDHILCSPVKRTRKTLEILNIPDTKTDFCNEIYANQPEMLHQLIVENTYADTLLLVGHNPSLLELAISYDPNADEKWHNVLSWGLNPAQIIVLEFNDLRIEFGNGKIIDIFAPIIG